MQSRRTMDSGRFSTLGSEQLSDHEIEDFGKANPEALACRLLPEPLPGTTGERVMMRNFCNLGEEGEYTPTVKRADCGVVRTIRLKGGALFSWGSGEMGQLGIPTETVHSYPKDNDGYPYLSTPTEILRHRQAFNGSATNSHPLDTVRVRRVAAGDGHSAAVTVNGKLYTWGASACGQLGHEDMDATMPKDVENYPYQPVPRLVKALADTGHFVVRVSCGDAHTMVATRQGEVFSWGGGGCGQLGYSSSSPMQKDDDGCPFQPLPRRVEGLEGEFITAIACGKAHSIAVSSRSGHAFSWGAGACGQLGQSEMMALQEDEDGYPFQPVPKLVCSLSSTRLVDCAAGDVHSLFLSVEGEVFSCGGGNCGQLGLGADASYLPLDQDSCPYSPTPTLVKIKEEGGELRKAHTIACGDQHALCIDELGRIWAWGSNTYGQLGLPLPSSGDLRDAEGAPYLPFPVQVTGKGGSRDKLDKIFVKVGKSGRSKRWERVGLECQTLILCGLVPFFQVAGAEMHSLALDSAGQVYGWGSLGCGQVGLGEEIDADRDKKVSAVTAIPSLSFCLDVCCGGVHSLAVVADPDASSTPSTVSLAADMDLMFTRGIFADLTASFDCGSPLLLHSCILKSRAPKLLACFSEKKAEFKGVRREVFADLAYFLYSDDTAAYEVPVGRKRFVYLVELYHLAERFGVLGLLPVLSRGLKRHLQRRGVPMSFPSPPRLDPQASHMSSGQRRGGPPPSAGVDATASLLSLSPQPSPSSELYEQSDSDEGGPEGLPGGCGLFFLPTGKAVVVEGNLYKQVLAQSTVISMNSFGSEEKQEGDYQSALLGLINDESTSDVLMRCEDKEFYVHRCVLAARSPYFLAMWGGEFREASDLSGARRTELKIQDATADQMHSLLMYIYGNVCVPLAKKVKAFAWAKDMMPLADKYQISTLRMTCERVLGGSISIDNAAKVFEMADRYGCPSLREKVLAFVGKGQDSTFYAVMKSKSFADLPKTLIIEMIHSREHGQSSEEVEV